jgi:hypothetical protein
VCDQCLSEFSSSRIESILCEFSLKVYRQRVQRVDSSGREEAKRNCENVTVYEEFSVLAKVGGRIAGSS